MAFAFNLSISCLPRNISFLISCSLLLLPIVFTTLYFPLFFENIWMLMLPGLLETFTSILLLPSSGSYMQMYLEMQLTSSSKITISSSSSLANTGAANTMAKHSCKLVFCKFIQLFYFFPLHINILGIS
jgi:hypothetical protein